MCSPPPSGSARWSGWPRTGSAPSERLGSLGAGTLAGVLIGEGGYGLGFLADSTYPPYWWAEIAAGLLVLAAAAVWRRRAASEPAILVVTSAVVAGAFVAVYSQDLLGLL